VDHASLFQSVIFSLLTHAGTTLSGRPEARFEAYSRGFAGCGPYVSDLYRRSYGRMYESICCANHKTDDKYLELWKTRPADIVGRYVRLEALDAGRHLSELFTLTSGEPGLQNKAFDPEEIWSFQPEGPFASEKEMRESFVFQRLPDEAAFAIVHAVTDRLMGAFLVTNDDPKNLTIQIESPLMQPAYEGCPEQLEAIFLLLDRLYGYGYRRIQISIDSQDVHKRKLATRLGFTLEGLLFKHKIIKESSRDSNIYSMLNSDWNKGARAALFTKLYGALACKVDAANEKKEEELDEQTRQLAAKKLKEAAEAEASKRKND
jgi:RimJ/RimL family protein N-acetyltransferase